MTLTLISGFLKSSGDDALLLMNAGGKEQIVLVTKQALRDISFPPRADEFRLQEHINTFGEIASAKYDAGQIQPDGRVWITPTDVEKWHASHVA